MGRGVLGTRVAFNLSKTPAERILWEQERRRLMHKVRDPEESESEDSDDESSVTHKALSRSMFRQFFTWGCFTAVVGGFAVAAFFTYALIFVATSEEVPRSSEESSASFNAEGPVTYDPKSLCSEWDYIKYELGQWFSFQKWKEYFKGDNIHPQTWHPCITNFDYFNDWDKESDDSLPSTYNPCTKPSEVAAQAQESGKPYLVVPGWKFGYSGQIQNLLKALWLAKITNSILVLPKFYVTHEYNISFPKETQMGRYFNVEELITRVYCTLGIRVVPDFPRKLKSQIKNFSSSIDFLLKAPLSLTVPEGIISGSSPDDIIVKSWLDDIQKRISSREVRIIVYPYTLRLNFTNKEQVKLKKEGLSALFPSKDIRQLAQNILQSLGREYRQRIGGKEDMQFVSLHLYMETGQNPLSPSEIVSRMKKMVDPSRMVLYVASGYFPEKDVVLGEFAQSYSLASKEIFVGDLKKKFPELEIYAALDQWVSKEATLYLGFSTSSFSNLIFQMRCFSLTSYGKLFRNSVFYDKGPFFVPCQIKPS